MSGVWKTLDTAPRGTKREDGRIEPVPVLLFLPAASFEATREGRPENVKHVRHVGWWDDQQQSFVASLHPDKPAVKVYPSLWAELPAEPELGT